MQYTRSYLHIIFMNGIIIPIHNFAYGLRSVIVRSFCKPHQGKSPLLQENVNPIPTGFPRATSVNTAQALS